MIGRRSGPVCPHLIHNLRHDRVVANRKPGRIGPRLRVSGWLPPGLVLGCLAVLATFIHGPVKLLVVWAATSGFVVLAAVTVWRLQRRATSPAAAAHFTSTAEDLAEASGAGQVGNAAASTGPGSGPGPTPAPPATPPLHGTPSVPPPSPAVPALSPQPSAPAVGELAVTLGLHVLTTVEVASVLRVDATAIAKAISKGELPGNRIGGDWRVDLGALRRWLQGRYPAPGALSGPAGHAPFEDEQT
jgi:excisionase family DNA binding protein